MSADKTAANSIFRDGKDIVKMSERGAPRPPYVTSESALVKSAPFTRRNIQARADLGIAEDNLSRFFHAYLEQVVGHE